MRLTHLCFTDDLLIFSRVDRHTVQTIRETLQEFAALSSLCLNPSKSFIFVSNSSGNMKNMLVTLTGFQEGALPVTYLGVPLTTSALRLGDCDRLVDSITSRITHWTSRFLSYAGRLQLVNSVFFVIQMYWSLLFILPFRVYKKLEKLISKFLWFGSSMSSPFLKVPWEVVTRPRKEGGLGIKKLSEWRKQPPSSIFGLYSQVEKVVFGLSGCVFIFSEAKAYGWHLLLPNAHGSGEICWPFNTS